MDKPAEMYRFQRLMRLFFGRTTRSTSIPLRTAVLQDSHMSTVSLHGAPVHDAYGFLHQCGTCRQVNTEARPILSEDLELTLHHCTGDDLKPIHPRIPKLVLPCIRRLNFAAAYLKSFVLVGQSPHFAPQFKVVRIDSTFSGMLVSRI